MPVKTKPRATRTKRIVVRMYGYLPPSIPNLSIKDSNGNTISPYAPKFTVSGTLQSSSGGTIYGLIIDPNNGSVISTQSTTAQANWSLPAFDLTGQQPAGTQYSYFCKIAFESDTHDDATAGIGVMVQF